jgi:hypothetical protein
MTNDPGGEWKPADEWDEVTAFNRADESPQNPFHVARRFIQELVLTTPGVAYLQSLTTPESWSGWGDFTAARAGWMALDRPGFSSRIGYPPDDPDTALIKVVEGFEQTVARNSVPSSTVSKAIMLHRDSETKGWLVHAFVEGAQFVTTDYRA